MGSSSTPAPARTAARGEHASLLRLFLTIPAAIIFPFSIVLVQPGFFDNVAETMGLTPRIGALAYFVSAAVTEEATKAAAINVADLRRTRFSWFWITFAVAGIVGLTEVGVKHLLFFGPNGYPDEFGPLAFANVRTVSGHIALSLICVVLSHATGGRLTAWFGAVAVAGVLHCLVNFGRGGMFGVPPGGPAAYIIGTWLLFVVVILLAFIWRKRFDWRVMDPALNHNL